MSVGFGTTTSWTETYTYPSFQVAFHCSDKVFGPELLLREVSSEDMKLLVKDLKGGLQVEKVLENSPNEKRLFTGDVILKTGGARVETIPQFMIEFTAARREIPVEILREGVRKSVRVRSSEVSELLRTSQKSIVDQACFVREISTRPLCSQQGK